MTTLGSSAPVPPLRSLDEAEAHALYLDSLGFTVDLILTADQGA